MLEARSRSSDVPAVRSRPSLLDDVVFELRLALGKIRRIGEALDVLDALGVDHAQFVRPRWTFARFVPQILPSTFKPPEHDRPLTTTDREPRRPDRHLPPDAVRSEAGRARARAGADETERARGARQGRPPVW